MTPQEIVLQHVIPGIGMVFALAAFGSPLPAVIKADRTKKLNSLNPLPYVAMAANCTLGSLYGQITQDAYIYFPNMIGLMLSWFYIHTSYKFLSAKDQDRVRLLVLAAVGVLLLVGVVNLWQVVDPQQLWGSTAVALLCIYYVAPLSTLVQVLRERDSSSIYWPLSLMNLVNAVLWTVYGLARKDWFFIAMPNAMGVAFNTVSLLLCALLPARERQVSTAAAKGDSSSSSRQPSMLKRLLQSFGGRSSGQDEGGVLLLLLRLMRGLCPT